jgi:hypothetical protein
MQHRRPARLRQAERDLAQSTARAERLHGQPERVGQGRPGREGRTDACGASQQTPAG